MPTRITTHSIHASVASAPAAPAPAAPPATESQSTIKPIVDTTPAPPHTAAKAAPSHSDNRALEVGAGALALLAIGGGAWALSRRRRHEEEFVDEAYEPQTVAEAEPVEPAPAVSQEQPAIVAPSAFAWGNQPAASDDGSDRRPGESWVERAYRGPSPANPSVSLRARLKRAAFFDKREREVAAGIAEPVETDAGLPEAMADEREFA